MTPARLFLAAFAVGCVLSSMALAYDTRPVGVTTYGAMAAAVAAGQQGGDPVAAAQAASAGVVTP